MSVRVSSVVSCFSCLVLFYKHTFFSLDTLSLSTALVHQPCTSSEVCSDLMFGLQAQAPPFVKGWCPGGGREEAASQEGGQHGLCPAARGRFHVLGTRQLSRRDGGSDGDRLLLRQWRHLQRRTEQDCNRCGSSSNHTSTLEYAGRARNAISEAVRRNRLCRCTRCCRHGVHGMGAQQATRRGAHAGPLAARALGAVAEQPALELLPQPEWRLATMVLHRRRVGLLRRSAMPNRERYTPTAAL